MKLRLCAALGVALLLAGCQVTTAPVVAPHETTATVYATALHDSTYHWETEAWSGGRVAKGINLYQRNSFGMSLSRVPKGSTLVVDGTGKFDPQWLIDNHAGVIRYVGTGGSWKRMDRSEYQSYVKRHIAVGLAVESSAARMLGGWAAGKADALAFLADASKVGYPRTSVAYFCCDTDLPANSSSVHNYLKGAASVLPLGVKQVGLYAGYGPITYNAKRPSDFDINLAKTADWGQIGYAPQPSPTPAPVKPPTYHTRAVLRYTTGLYADAHLTHRIGYARRGGVVSVLNVNSVRTVSHIAWGKQSGYMKYDAMRWLP